MTNEEVLKLIEDGRIIPIQIKANDEETSKYNLENIEALNMIIKALKQKPCEDCISREAVLDLVVANHTELNGLNVVMYSPLCKDIKQLPSVTPQPITGYWIQEEVRGSLQNRCSVCDRTIDTTYFYNYCPNCGKRMGVE